jgi:hypothetical protein
MTAIILALLFHWQGGQDQLSIRRGWTAPNGLTAWDYENTTLDANAPSTNFGGDTVLTGGPHKTILLRFGDLSRLVPPTQRVKKARLVLTAFDAMGTSLSSAGRVLVPWSEGPYPTLNALLTPHPITLPGQAKEESFSPPGASSWRFRRGGSNPTPWQRPGAIGASQEIEGIPTAKLVEKDSEKQIEGIEGAVQAMIDHPDQNFGFALAFDKPCSFNSGRSDVDRPRLDLELEDIPLPKGPDLSVTRIERQGSVSESGPVTYTAHLRNVGDKVADGFSYAWVVNNREGSHVASPKSVAPGEEVTVSYQVSERANKTDHRFGTVGFRVQSESTDVNPRNNALKYFSEGQSIDVILSKRAMDSLQSSDNTRGSRSAEDWIQSQFEFFNDVYLAQSRFSFAPDGVRERVNVRSITLNDHPPSSALGTLVWDERIDPSRPSLGFQREIAKAIGLADRSRTNIARGQDEKTGRGGEDRFAGLMGYGDTRFEGAVPGDIPLRYEPSPSPIFDQLYLESNHLLSATDVAELNSRLGDDQPAVPRTILLRAMGPVGEPLSGTKLEFYQAKEGKVAKDAAPAFEVTTDSRGTAILPNRPEGLFGNLSTSMDNGLFLVIASSHGVRDSAWLKAWQLEDSFIRRPKASRAICLVDMQFQVSGVALDSSVNLALDRIISDSNDSLPAKLAAVNDGSVETESELPGKVRSWFEIDLGRDRTIGEVDVIAGPNSMWSKFELVAYATGQKPEEAIPWASETDWKWTASNRGEEIAKDRALVRYRGLPMRFRFLRILSRTAPEGKIAELRVVPVHIGP